VLRRIAVRVPAEQAEHARALMIELFPEGFEEVGRPNVIELAAYTDADGAGRLWRAFGEVSTSAVPEDWAERWRLFHRPVTVGRLWIGPPWERPPDGVVAVVIDPGRAFGTGAHETTRLCLELMVGVRSGSLLDIGCGSGVLAIAAAKLGFDPVSAIDHDLPAVEAARRNAEVNNVQVRVSLRDAFEGPVPRADVAVANLSRTAVERVAGMLETPTLITSGYLSGERPEPPGYLHVERRSAGAWAADRWNRAG
jgi:ribosomal protein L11 methyltransferase